MLENRAFRIALIVIFVILLFYNVLYFTGYLGGEDVAQVQQVQEPMLDVPGLQGQGQRDTAGQRAARPVPSRERAARRQAAAEPPRQAVPVAELTPRSDWGRNPFLTPAEIAALASPAEMAVARGPATDIELQVTAIVTENTGRRVAVVNNEVVTVGGTVGGMEVAEILDRAVVFRSRGSERVVPLSDTAIQLRVRRKSSSGRSYE